MTAVNHILRKFTLFLHCGGMDADKKNCAHPGADANGMV